MKSLKLMIKSNQTSLGHVWTWYVRHWAQRLFPILLHEETVWRWALECLKIAEWKSLPSLSFLGWIRLKGKTENSKIDWNNRCENNYHRNMRGQSGHILPVMNSKYMWCIRVTLMAQLCHEKIEAYTLGIWRYFCKAGNGHINAIKISYKNDVSVFWCIANPVGNRWYSKNTFQSTCWVGKIIKKTIILCYYFKCLPYWGKCTLQFIVCPKEHFSDYKKGKKIWRLSVIFLIKLYLAVRFEAFCLLFNRESSGRFSLNSFWRGIHTCSSVVCSYCGSQSWINGEGCIRKDIPSKFSRWRRTHWRLVSQKWVLGIT